VARGIGGGICLPLMLIDRGVGLMGLPAGIVLTAIGAVLAFAVHATVSGLDVRAVGWILMIVGVIGILLDLALFAPRRRQVATTTYPTTTATHTVVRHDEIV
jgi:hypothetical protein